MDPITHAASGAVAMLALRRRPPRAVLAGALAAAAPDIDILFGNDPLTTLLLHRGITHALPAVPVFALLLALAALPLLRGGSSERIYLSSSSPGRWSFPAVWLCMVCMVLLHIWLDCVTTYGTLIFLPFSAERVRLNAVFIIDFLLTLPLLWTVWRCRASRRRNYQDKRSALAAARLALLWVFVYPLLGAGLNALHTSHVTEALRADTSRREAVLEEVVVLPDAFAPFFWRVIWQERPVGVSPAGADALLRADLPDSGSVVRTAGLDLLGRLRTPFSEPRPAMPRDAAAALASRSVEAGAFFEFALLPGWIPCPMPTATTCSRPPSASGAAMTSVSAPRWNSCAGSCPCVPMRTSPSSSSLPWTPTIRARPGWTPCACASPTAGATPAGGSPRNPAPSPCSAAS